MRLFLPYVTVLLFNVSGFAYGTDIGLQFFVGSDEVGSDAKLERMVSELNGYFRNSHVHLTATVSHIETVHFGSTDALVLLEDMHGSRGTFSSLRRISDRYGADFSIALVPDLKLRGREICGRGYAVNKTETQLKDPSRAVAVMRMACGSHTLAHELGHLMGLNHGHQVERCQPGKGNASAVTPYANGYAVGNCDGQPQAGEFGTIMVGGWMRRINGERSNRFELFSNPDVKDPRCGLGQRCGDPETGNAAAVLNHFAKVYAGHEEPDVDTLDFSDSRLKTCLVTRYRGREIDALHQLNCAGSGIANLSGIGKLTSLRDVDFRNNQLTTLQALLTEPVGAWRNLRLEGNHDLDCAALARLQQRMPQLTIGYPNHCGHH